MSKPIDIWVNDFSSMLDNFPAFVDVVLRGVALDAKAIIERRVVSTGVSANGIPYTPYSNYWRRERQKRGKQVDHKDFMFTQSMWRNTGIVGITPASVTIGPASQDRHKAQYNVDREKVEILDLNEKEITMIEKAIEFEINKYFGRL
jgi:hypothetical protein